MNLSDVAEQYGTQFLEKYRQRLLPGQIKALKAIQHSLTWQHQRQVYDLLFKIAADTLKQFGANNKHLDADLGMTGVLHTHSRRLDYHPHVHFVVPGGGINLRRKEWRKLKGKYLFNGKNLAKVEDFEQNSLKHWMNKGYSP